MSLRTTILVAVALTFIGLVALMLVNIQTILSTHFAREEEQSITLDIQRARGVVENEYIELQAAARQLGQQPAVIAAAQPLDRARLENGLAQFDPTHTRLDLAAVLDSQGKLLAAWPSNMTGALAAVVDGLQAGQQGLLTLAEGPLMVAVQSGPSSNLILVGLFLSSERLAALGRVASISLELFSIENTNLSLDARTALTSLQQGRPVVIYTSGDDSVAGFTFLSSARGQPAYMLKTLQPRSTYQSGQLVTNYLLTFLIASTLVFAVLISLLLERLVLSRLSLLSREVVQIGQSGDLTRSVTVSQHDELTRVGANINAMLAELRQRVDELQALIESSNVLMGQLDTASTLDSICRLAVDKFGLRSAWIGHNWIDGSQLAPVAWAGTDMAHLPVVHVIGRAGDQPMAAQALLQAQAIFRDHVAAIPVSSGSNPLAVLVLTSHEGEPFTPSRQRHVLAFTAQAGLALQSARLYGQVRTAQRRLETLSHRLVEVQEDERRRIAQELHDEIGQTLTGLKLLLDTSANRPEKTGQAGQLVNELIGTVRQMSLDLRPAMLDDLGLLPALLWLIDRYSSQTGIQVEFAHSGLEGRRFSSEVEITAYRLVQEGLTNIARHAGVNQASVGIWMSAESLMVNIADRGKGFDFDSTAQQKEGRGLLGMRERVLFVGGKLFIDSQPGQGTTIQAELPPVEAAG